MERKEFIKQLSFVGIGVAGIPLGNKATSNSLNQKNVATLKKANPRIKKKIIVIGAGIGGLCCAYELTRMGHEVVILEAASRYGGKVFSANGDLPDGLYGEYGAEGFTIPSYIRYREYLEEFGLPYTLYPHQKDRLTLVGNEWLAQSDMEGRRMAEAAKIGSFTPRERQFLNNHPSGNLDQLFLRPYFEKFKDEYQPLGIGYDELDFVPVSDIYEKEGASKAALSLLGGGGTHTSALHKIWESYIMDKRGIWDGQERYRIVGGNQRLIEEFAKRLSPSIYLACRVTDIEQGNSGVTVTYREHDEQKVVTGDYVANCLPLPAQKNIIFTPDLPAEKRFVFDNMALEQTARILFQARSAFWEKDNIGINLTFNHRSLRDVARVAEEVETDRVVFKAKAPGGTKLQDAVKAFRDLYPGNKKNIDIEGSLIKDWSIDPFTPGCQRTNFPFGQLAKFWPHIHTPVGKVYFAGGYADNRPWGMEAAINSANRAAQQIDQD